MTLVYCIASAICLNGHKGQTGWWFLNDWITAWSTDAIFTLHFVLLESEPMSLMVPSPSNPLLSLFAWALLLLQKVCLLFLSKCSWKTTVAPVWHSQSHTTSTPSHCHHSSLLSSHYVSSVTKLLFYFTMKPIICVNHKIIILFEFNLHFIPVAGMNILLTILVQ